MCSRSSIAWQERIQMTMHRWITLIVLGLILLHLFTYSSINFARSNDGQKIRPFLSYYPMSAFLYHLDSILFGVYDFALYHTFDRDLSFK